jgi:hypothetical protein
MHQERLEIQKQKADEDAAYAAQIKRRDERIRFDEVERTTRLNIAPMQAISAYNSLYEVLNAKLVCSLTQKRPNTNASTARTRTRN